jgi:hypothetical protein
MKYDCSRITGLVLLHLFDTNVLSGDGVHPIAQGRFLSIEVASRFSARQPAMRGQPTGFTRSRPAKYKNITLTLR